MKIICIFLIIILFSTYGWGYTNACAFSDLVGINFVTQEKEKAGFLIREASYTKEYVEKNTGRVIVAIPEVYELANIAIAITNYGLSNPNRVIKEGRYYQRVLEYFLPFKNHPLISRIEFSDEKLGDYFSFRDNSICYVFKGDSIIPEGIYSNVRIPDFFKKHIDLIEDFAKASQFRKFYSDNLIYYRELIEKYKKKVPVRKMWAWLERNFPEKYDCYKIIFSPLIKYSHETVRFKGDHFR